MQRKIKTVCILLISYATIVTAQAEMSSSPENVGPSFHYDVVNVAVPTDSSLSRLFVYVKIAHDELQFFKVGDGYEAEYEVSAIIYDKDNEQVAGEEWVQNIFVESYDQTNSRTEFNLTYKSFDLPPGEYKVSISVEDTDTREKRSEKCVVTLRDFIANVVSLSNITLISDIEVDSLGVKSIRPEISDRSKGVQGNQYAYFEIYSTYPSKGVEIQYVVLNSKKKAIIKKKYEKQKTGFRTMDYFFLPIDSLVHDNYLLRVEVIDGKYKDEMEKLFYVRWTGMPTTIEDLDKAIEQVKYIASRKEFKQFNKADISEKLELFKQFWKLRDPTPGTELNEAMEEHYTRVEYANENFTVMQRDGWRTDMGMVFIILGPPDDIERNPYPRDSRPWEMWYYYRINRQFLYYDYSGFGEYRLSTPFSIYDFQRLR
jgi:GWxTD domain-containing protein